MSRSIGAGIAEGIESGFGLGRQIEADKLQKRAADRADSQFRLQSEREDRLERRERTREGVDLLGKKQTLLQGRRDQLVKDATAAQTAGLPVDPAAAEEFGQIDTDLAALQQEARNFFSRAATGQIDPMSAPPGELYTNLVAATGMSVPDLQKAPQHIKDVEAGLKTGNQGLIVQGVNGLMATQLRRGVGTPSPYGGKITRKEIIGLDPAVDGNMQPIPGKFMPRLRVYVDTQDGDSDGGGERYYDAPMTVDGSGDDDDRVAVIDIKDGMNWMGNLGTLATAISRPDVQAKLQEGEKVAGARTKAFLDKLTAVSRPAGKGAAAEKLDLIKRHAKENNLTQEQAAEELRNMGVLPSVGALQQQIAAINELDVSGEEKTRLLRDAVLKAGGKTTGLIKKAGGGTGGTGDPSAALSKKYTTNKEYAQQVDYWADLLAKGGTLPPRFAQSGAGKEMFSDIVQRVPQMSTDANEMLSNQAEVGGIKAGARAVGTRAANFGLAKSEAYEMADLVTQASDAYGRTGFQPINKALNAFNTNTGDVKVRQFGAALNSFINAYARAVSPIGTPTVSDKDHAREMLSTADSPEQVRGIIDQLKREMDAAGRAPKVVRQEQRDAAREIGAGRSSPSAPSSNVKRIKDAAEYNALPSGTEFIDPKGVKRRKP